jgi:hypothetical protein
MIKAPRIPSRHSLRRNPKGDRQRIRQAYLRGVNWKIPAARSNNPPKIGLELTIVGESKAAEWSPHWPKVAKALYQAQATI